MVSCSSSLDASNGMGMCLSDLHRMRADVVDAPLMREMLDIEDAVAIVDDLLDVGAS